VAADVKGVEPPSADYAKLFGMPDSPAFFNRNIPEPMDVLALAKDKARLARFLAPGYLAWRQANSRTYVGYNLKTDDPLKGQKSNVDAREETLRAMDWFWIYGPTLLEVLDVVALDGAVTGITGATAQPPVRAVPASGGWGYP
jgi:hypothetical protein